MQESNACEKTIDAQGPLEFVPPTAADSAPIWQLVRATPALDDNSPYAYLLLTTHFSDSTIVARRGPELLGFVAGYVRPDDRATAFVWQIGVANAARGSGLGARLLDAWFARCARNANTRFVEATVTPSNERSRRLFASFATRHGASVREFAVFPARLFPGEAPHEEELGIRIGPVRPSQAFSANQNPNP